jgi:hypothetical protein
MCKNNERCDHGNPYDGKCKMCQDEYRELIGKLQEHLGGGDKEKGRRLILKIFEKYNDDYTK